MPADEGSALFLYAYEKTEEEKIFVRWIPYQSEMSFDDFKKAVTKKQVIDNRTSDEILRDVASVANMLS